MSEGKILTRGEFSDECGRLMAAAMHLAFGGASGPAAAMQLAFGGISGTAPTLYALHGHDAAMRELVRDMIIALEITGVRHPHTGRLATQHEELLERAKAVLPWPQ